MNVALFDVVPPAPDRSPRIICHASAHILDIGLLIYGVTIKRRLDGNLEAILPVRTVYKGTQLVLNEDGFPQKKKTLQFINREKTIDFANAIVAALRRDHPEYSTCI